MAAFPNALSKLLPGPGTGLVDVLGAAVPGVTAVVDVAGLGGGAGLPFFGVAGVGLGAGAFAGTPPRPFLAS